MQGTSIVSNVFHAEADDIRRWSAKKIIYNIFYPKGTYNSFYFNQEIWSSSYGLVKFQPLQFGRFLSEMATKDIFLFPKNNSSELHDQIFSVFALWMDSKSLNFSKRCDLTEFDC